MEYVFVNIMKTLRVLKTTNCKLFTPFLIGFRWFELMLDEKEKKLRHKSSYLSSIFLPHFRSKILNNSVGCQATVYFDISE